MLASCGGSPKSPAPPATACPPNIAAAVATAYPDAPQKGCKAEHEDGKDIYEVVVIRTGGSEAEVELSPDGTILQTEEVISVVALPGTVATAFATRYPGQRPTRVEKIGIPNQPPRYEIAFGTKEATFSEAGELIEEE